MFSKISSAILKTLLLSSSLFRLKCDIFSCLFRLPMSSLFTLGLFSNYQHIMTKSCLAVKKGHGIISGVPYPLTMSVHKSRSLFMTAGHPTSHLNKSDHQAKSSVIAGCPKINEKGLKTGQHLPKTLSTFITMHTSGGPLNLCQNRQTQQ